MSSPKGFKGSVGYRIVELNSHLWPEVATDDAYGFLYLLLHGVHISSRLWGWQVLHSLRLGKLIT